MLRDDPPARYLLIATGTGVSPYRAMLPQLRTLLDGENYQATLMLGVRSPEELLFGEDFLALARENSAFQFITSYSRMLSNPPKPHERKGYVQDHLMELNPDPAHDIVYLCGNPDMIDSAVLGERYRSNAEALGRTVRAPSPAARVVGSTDMGNVSYEVPAIHPMIQAAPLGVAIHTPEFARFAAGPEGDRAVIDGAKALAGTGADLGLDPERVQLAKAIQAKASGDTVHISFTDPNGTSHTVSAVLTALPQ